MVVYSARHLKNYPFPVPNKTAICMIGSSERDNTTIDEELLELEYPWIVPASIYYDSQTEYPFFP